MTGSLTRDPGYITGSRIIMGSGLQPWNQRSKGWGRDHGSLIQDKGSHHGIKDHRSRGHGFEITAVESEIKGVGQGSRITGRSEGWAMGSGIAGLDQFSKHQNKNV